MKVLYIHQYFVTPNEYGSTRSYWFAKKLLEHGHQVVMVTSTRDNKLRQPGRKLVDGIEVIYIDSSYNNLMNVFSKMMAFVKFMIGAIYAGMRETDVDLVYATSTPLSIGVIAWILKKIKGYKYIFEVRDLWPEFPIQIGAIRNKWVIKLLKKLEVSIYKNSEFIVALSPGMKEGVISTGISAQKVAVIPNMSKSDIFYPRERSRDAMERFNIDPEKFNVVHFGSMGEANGLEYIAKVASILHGKGDRSIQFHMVGYGQTEAKLKLLVENQNLANVKFHGKHSSIVTSDIVNCCDVTITTFKALPILETNSPNKFFDSLSAGKPVIVNVNGWMKSIVEQHKCGFYADVFNADDLADKLLVFKSNRKLIDEWGENARRLALTTFDKTILSQQFLEIIQKYGK